MAQHPNFDPDRETANANSLLQVKGAIQSMKSAESMMAACLALGGNVPVDHAPIAIQMPPEVTVVELLQQVARLNRLVVGLAYRQKVPFEDTGKILQLDSQQVLRLLGQFLEGDRKLVQQMFLAELEVQGRNSAAFPS